MTSIAQTVIGCIDYLAFLSIFICVMLRPKNKLNAFYPTKKSQDVRWEVVPATHALLPPHLSFSLSTPPPSTQQQLPTPPP